MNALTAGRDCAILRAHANCPVHYATGQKNLAFTDLASPALGSLWGHTRVVNNIAPGATGGAHGHGVLLINHMRTCCLPNR